MITQELKDIGCSCKGKGFNCHNCKDKKECLDYIDSPKVSNVLNLLITNTNNNINIIKINVETHNPEDWYYTYHYPLTFYSNLPKDEIEKILNSINTKEFKYQDYNITNMGLTEINTDYLEEILRQNKIFKLRVDIEHNLELE